MNSVAQYEQKVTLLRPGYKHVTIQNPTCKSLYTRIPLGVHQGCVGTKKDDQIVFCVVNRLWGVGITPLVGYSDLA